MATIYVEYYTHPPSAAGNTMLQMPRLDGNGPAGNVVDTSSDGTLDVPAGVHYIAVCASDAAAWMDYGGDGSTPSGASDGAAYLPTGIVRFFDISNIKDGPVLEFDTTGPTA